jgi:hypothetical protein
MIRVTRREFSKILEIFLLGGIVMKDNTLRNIFLLDVERSDAAEASANGQSQSPSTLPDIAGLLSSYVQKMTDALNNATTVISTGNFIMNSDGSASVQTPPFSFSAAGGVMAAYNFRTTDYVMPQAYTVSVPLGAANVSTPAMSISIGTNIGFGDVKEGFFGQSMGGNAGPVTFSINDKYVSLGYQHTIAGVSGATVYGESNTSPYGDVKYGNAGNDLESGFNSLVKMWEDPLNKVLNDTFDQ